MGLVGQNYMGSYPRSPDVSLSMFEHPEAIAAWQASTIIALLNQIDQLAQDVEDSERYLGEQVDPDTQIVMLDDDEEERLDREREGVISQVAYLLTAVVACTSLPNVLLPYDQAEQLSFDNRPNPKFARSDAMTSLLDSD